MPHLSRHSLNKQTQKQLTSTLNITLSRISNYDQMQGFLSSLLSPTERLMLAKRLAMVILLKEGVPESSIAKSLHVTRSTVDRLKLFLEARGRGYEIAFKELEKEKILQTFKKFLLSLARYSVRAAGGYVKPSILD